ncbi:hypothetical protein [Pseudomonas cichorii]|uniref:Uncharacterized protein n=1 Tax=Pseudomonas cichorii TaxID=36746 RepID=A0ABQ1DT32_PSECI|nr:hypothetical protein [Pseudomonas cichorii]AHF66007.1 hypothetical protein PCH70_08540 [Pseudomonas cichorii JBC1]GFM68684.1 hypothetical protein PSCICJ_48020 [Pseudomonas cichorii]GFM94177.1 hypothetical protein PSCICP_41490 [Pseudomonas cichorii]SDP00692.1 hypothetical protein SAMN05216599_116142 [Pseudomonas cichorii]
MATSKDYDPILAGDIVQAADAKRKQTSFDATNSPQYLSKPVPVATPAPTGPVGRAAQQMAAASPARSLADAYPTGIGDGKRAIYAGVGGNGEASFSDAPSSINTVGPNFTAPDVPQAQRMTSLADGWRSGAGQQPAVNQPRTLADLGTVRNMGDGIGTFSQAEPGDAALASTRFQRANDERQKYQDNQRLNLANARLAQDQNFTVVRDSSRRPSLSDALYDQGRQQNTQNLQGAVASAQGQIDAGRAGRAADQQQRQALRLEDAFQAASSPNATPEQQAAYQRLADPLNEKGLKRQQIQADIDAKNARSERDRAEAAKAQRNVRGLPAALQKLEDADIEAVGSVRTMTGALDKIDSQISDGTLKLGLVDNATSAVRNAFGDSDQTSANYASMLATMEKLRNESLRLNKGTQTEGDAQRAWNELFTNIRDPKIVQQRIKEINGYNGQAAALRRATINNRRANQGFDALDVDGLLDSTMQASPATPPQAQQQVPSPSPSQGPVYTISTDEQFARLPSGAEFIDPQGNHRRKP